MPFKSKAQQRWMFANKPEMAKRWAKHTKDIKSLPEKQASISSVFNRLVGKNWRVGLDNLKPNWWRALSGEAGKQMSFQTNLAGQLAAGIQRNQRKALGADTALSNATDPKVRQYIESNLQRLREQIATDSDWHSDLSNVVRKSRKAYSPYLDTRPYHIPLLKSGSDTLGVIMQNNVFPKMSAFSEKLIKYQHGEKQPPVRTQTVGFPGLKTTPPTGEQTPDFDPAQKKAALELMEQWLGMSEPPTEKNAFIGAAVRGGLRGLKFLPRLFGRAGLRQGSRVATAGRMGRLADAMKRDLNYEGVFRGNPLGHTLGAPLGFTRSFQPFGLKGELMLGGAQMGGASLAGNPLAARHSLGL